MCIYEIVNQQNGHRYVGSTLKGFEWRKRKHIRELQGKKHHNRHLQYAYDFYGPSCFQFNILEEVIDASQLITKEQEWINKLHPIYNVMRDIKSHIGIKRSEETCRKISQSLTGKHLSEQAKEKLRQWNLGKKQSEETKRKRAIRQYKPILQLDLNGNLIQEWSSATEAALKNGYRRSSLYRCIWGDRHTFKGFRWKQKDST